MKDAAGGGEGVNGVLMEIRNRDPSSQCGKVMMLLRHVGAGLCGKRIHLRRRDAIVEAFNDLLCHWYRIHKLGVKTLTERADAFSDAVEADLLVRPVTFHDVHWTGHGRRQLGLDLC